MDDFVTEKLEALKRKNEQAYTEFVASFKEGFCKKGEILHQVNDVCRTLYVLQSGIVKQFRYKEDGTEHILWFGFEGEPVTAYKSYVKQVPSPEGIEVLEDCRYLSIDRDVSYQLAAKYHAVETFFRELLEDYYILADDRLFFLQALSAKQKYDYLLKNMPHFLQRLPQKEISSFLGVSRETLSRIKKYA